MQFSVIRGLRTLPEEPAGSGRDHPRLEVLTEQEGLELCEELTGGPVLKKILAETGQYCRAELLPECTLGTLIVPDRGNSLQSCFSAVFYINGQRMLLMVPEDRRQQILELFEGEAFRDCADLFQLFFRFLGFQVQGDMLLLQNYEKRLSTMEEAITETFPREWEKNINSCRRELLKLHSFYQQLMDMCELLAANDNQLFPEEYSLHFSRLGARIDRLYDQTQMLREYALQIREIYQSQMDLKQNDTMRMLTVVTTIFLPLSLLTGWYGMNFDHMPELREPAAYFILTAVCGVLVLLEIWYFKKKGWL